MSETPTRTLYYCKCGAWFHMHRKLLVHIEVCMPEHVTQEAETFWRERHKEITRDDWLALNPRP